MKLRDILVIVMGLALATAISAGQSTTVEPGGFNFGVYGAVDFQEHAPNFSKFDGIPGCCNNRYPDSNAIGIHVGISTRWFLSRRLFLELRLGGDRLYATFRKPETLIIAGMEGPKNVPVAEPLLISHVIDATLDNIHAGTLVGYRLLDGLHLYAGATASTIVRSDIRYREQIDTPYYAVFTDGEENAKWLRNVYHGSLKSTGLPYVSFDYSLGIGYSFPIDKREHLWLEPQVFYSQGLNSIIKQDSGTWHVNSLRLGLAVRYTSLGIPPPPPPGPLPERDDPPLRPE